MAPIDYDDDIWTIDALKATLESHILFKRHGMVIPEDTSEDNLRRAAYFLDQYNPSTSNADGNEPKLIVYDAYDVKRDLRPMCKAVGIENLRAPGMTKDRLVKELGKWDRDNAPRIAAFLPRPNEKEDKPVVPKKVVQTQEKIGTKPSKSKKRKAVPTKPKVTSKRRDKIKVTPEHDDVDMEDQNESYDGGFLPQPATEGSTSTRTLRQKQTLSHKPRKDQAIATQTHLEANKGMNKVAHREVNRIQEDDSTNNASGHVGEEDDDEFGRGIGEVQGSGTERRGTGNQATRSGKAKKKPTKAGKAKTNLNEDGTPKTAEQLAEEQRQKDAEEEEKLHNARRLGGYSIPALAETFRVKHKTVHARMEGHIRPGVRPAPTDQLGTWRLYERHVDQAKEEERDLDLWMGGGASP